ncbi:MAG: TlpA family protein disulfide reductase [Acidobacteria bacterium]|nr:TlpA family protein disulfide reductase [Acidobacteriota bacterium]
MIFLRLANAFVCALGLLAAQSQLIEGTLDREVSRDATPSWVVSNLNPADGLDAGLLPSPISPARIWRGNPFWRGSGGELTLVLVLDQSGRYSLMADLNHNGRFESEEVVALRESTPGYHDGQIIISLPRLAFVNQPVLFRILHVNTREGAPQVLHINSSGMITGTASVAGQPVRVWIDYNADRGLDPRNGLLAVDGDGDGTISARWETALANDERVVFRAGSRYVSFESFDAANRRFTLRLHPVSDYLRIETRPGVEVPDFAFIDFEGKPHRLSEYSGKHVLLNFWASWCGPCVASIPKLKKLDAEWTSRGLVILGMNYDERPEAALDAARKHELSWTNARIQEIKNLIERQFRIASWPTYILIGPDRRIVASRGFLPETDIKSALGESAH